MDKEQVKLSDKVRRYIEGEIQKQGFPEGKLPTERILSEQLKVSRGTLRVALEELEKSGLITRYRNKGTYLNDFKKISGSFNKNLVLVFPSGVKQNSHTSNLDFYGSIYFSILGESSKREYSLITMSLNELGENVILEKCKNIKVDGLIFISSYEADFIRKFKQFKVPILIIDHKIEDLEIHSLNLNSYQGSFMAVQHLYGLGHRDIAFLNHVRWQELNKERANGFFDGLKYCGILPQQDYHRLCKPNAQSGFEAMSALLALSQRPTGVLCFDYSMAIGAIRACMNQGIRVPADVSLMGFRGYFNNASSGILSTIDAVEQNIGKIVFDEFFSGDSRAKLTHKDLMIDLKISDHGSVAEIHKQ